MALQRRVQLVAISLVPLNDLYCFPDLFGFVSDFGYIFTKDAFLHACGP